MALRRAIKILVTLVLVLLISVPINESAQAAGSDSVGKLFTDQQWQEIQRMSSAERGEQLLFKLNSRRDLIGEAALHIVQTNDNVKYQRTDAVFAAPRDGGGYVYAFVIYWFRDLFAGIGKDLVTKITWEVVDGHHLRARVAEDNSIFQPTHADDLDRMFNNLLPDAV